MVRRRGGDHSQAAEVVCVLGAIGAAYFLLLALALAMGPWVTFPGMSPFVTGVLFGLVAAGIRFAAMPSVDLLGWGLGQDPKLELGRALLEDHSEASVPAVVVHEIAQMLVLDRGPDVADREGGGAAFVFHLPRHAKTSAAQT